MKNTIKLALAATLSLLLVFGAIPFVLVPLMNGESILPAIFASAETSPRQTVVPEDDPTGEYEIFVYATGATYITKYTGTKEDIVLPEELAGHVILGLDEGAFAYNKTVKSVYIPDGYCVLGSGAFSGCTALESVRIPAWTQRVDTTEYGAPFYGCENLRKVEFAEDITMLPGMLFACSGIEEIVIPEGVEELDALVFSGCKSLKKVSLPSTLTKLGNGVFRNCTALTDVNIPAYLDSAPAKAGAAPFYGCTALSSVSFDLGITNICDNLFAYSGLTSVEVPDTVTRIGANSFASCTSLVSVQLPWGLGYLGESAFDSCTSLSSVNIPSSITYIGTKNGNYPFKNCGPLDDVTFESGVKTVPAYLFAESLIGSLTVPSTVREIGDSAFLNCRLLTDITWNENIRSLGKSAFEGCTGLTQAVVLPSMTSLSDAVYKNCTGLTSVTLPEGMTVLPESFFAGDTKLTSVELPSTLKTIGASAFSGCGLLSGVSFRNDTSSLVTVGSGAFYKCYNLTEILMPPTLREIGSSAYSYCSQKLTSVHVPSQIKVLGASAFAYCYALREIVIEADCGSIPDNVCNSCKKLEKVVISGSYTELGRNAFKACEKLTDFSAKDYSLLRIRDYALSGLTAATDIVLPKGVTRIDKYAFKGDTALRSLTVPASVTTLDANWLEFNGLTVLRGVKGSPVHDFAMTNGFSFVDISVPLEGLAAADGKKSLTLDVGETKFINYKIYPENASENIVLTSDVTSGVSINGNSVRFTKKGDYTLTAKSDSGLYFTLSVHVRQPDSLQIAAKPEKLSYTTGESLDETGLVVKVKYTDGSAKTVRDYTVSDLDSSTGGEKPVTVAWKTAQGLTLSSGFTVEVIDTTVRVVSLEIVSLPLKMKYYPGEKLDVTGLTVRAHYSDGTAKTVTGYSVTGYNIYSGGMQQIKVSYEDVSVGFRVLTSVTEVGTPYRTSGSYIFVREGILSDTLLSLLPGHAEFTGSTADFPGEGRYVCTGMKVGGGGEKNFTLVVKGDVDGDGSITAADARQTLRFAVGLDSPKTSEKKAAAVVNSTPAPSDARAILRAAVGLDDPIEWFDNI